MQCVMFILRPLQILVWAKMWDLDFGGAAGSTSAPEPYAQHVDDPMPSPRTVPVTVDGASAGPYSGGGTHIVGGDADGYRPSILPDQPARPTTQPPRARNLRERGARTETDDRTRRTTERGVPRSRSLDAMRTRCRPKRSRRRVASREDVTRLSSCVCMCARAAFASPQSPSSVANPTF